MGIPTSGRLRRILPTCRRRFQVPVLAGSPITRISISESSVALPPEREPKKLTESGSAVRTIAPDILSKIFLDILSIEVSLTQKSRRSFSLKFIELLSAVLTKIVQNEMMFSVISNRPIVQDIHE